jgi:hypothetical protein
MQQDVSPRGGAIFLGDAMVRRYWSNNDVDSVLFLPNQRNISKLTLIVRVHLHQFNPAGTHKEGHFYEKDDDVPAGGNTYVYQRWQPNEWENFKIGYKREVEFFLNWPLMGLWLRPSPLDLPDSMDELREFMNPNPISRRFKANVQCSLTVVLVETARQSHVSFEVLRLKDGQPDYRSYDRIHYNKLDTGRLTNRDVQSWPPPPGINLEQSVVSHELGHALNQQHSNVNDPKCINGNEDICYGSPKSRQRRNWMGGGNDVTTANAMPWLRSIYRHTQSLVWDATDQIPREEYFFE